MGDEASLAVWPQPAEPADLAKPTLAQALRQLVVQDANGKPPGQAEAPAQQQPPPAGEQPQAPDDAPDDQARRSARAAGAGYVGGGRVETEANFYGGVGGAHTGGGNVYNTYYGGAAPDGKVYSVERLLQPIIDKALKVYVPPPLPDTKAQQWIGTHHVFVLLGKERGTGKFTAAVKLLASMHSTELFDIRSTVDLDDSKAFVPNKDSGYLIENLAPDRARALNGALLRRLDRQLSTLHSHLIITVHAHAALEADLLGEYALAWDELPQPDPVLRKHVQWYVSDPAQRQKALSDCADPDVQDALKGQPPARLDQLARLLAEVARREKSLPEALDEFKANPKQQMIEWFDKHSELNQRTLLLAVAVLHGARYEQAIRADKQLQDAIKPPAADAAPPPPPIFERTGTARLKDVGAHIERKPEPVGADTIMVEKVVLDKMALRPAIIQYVWDEFAGLRATLLEWLWDLGKSDDPETRNGAAAAIGELATHDFGTIYKKIIEPSARSEDSRERFFAALALGILANRKELAPQILARLHQWSIESARPPRWTAALAYSLLVGRQYPTEALGDLYAMVRSKDSAILSVVRNSIIDIFKIGAEAPTYYLRVLESLDAWASDPRAGSLKEIWLDIFARIARSARHRPPAQPPQPTLPWIYEEFDLYQGPIRRLIQKALNIQASRADMVSALEAWLRAADDQPAIYGSLAQLIVDLVGQANAAEQERWRYWLARWSSDTKQPCESAAKIASALGIVY